MTACLRRRSGLALVLVGGILSLLVGISLLFVRSAQLLEASGQVDAERRAADRTAESGLEYAASRLGREGYPRHSTTPLDRGDDWTSRARRTSRR